MGQLFSLATTDFPRWANSVMLTAPFIVIAILFAVPFISNTGEKSGIAMIETGYITALAALGGAALGGLTRSQLRGPPCTPK
jgi:hypothetical protein